MQDITTVWSTAPTWFNDSVIKPVVGLFSTAWTDIREAFEAAFTAISNFAKTIFNGVIGLIEGIMYLTKSDEEFDETYVKGHKGWF